MLILIAGGAWLIDSMLAPYVVRRVSERKLQLHTLQTVWMTDPENPDRDIYTLTGTFWLTGNKNETIEEAELIVNGEKAASLEKRTIGNTVYFYGSQCEINVRAADMAENSGENSSESADTDTSANSAGSEDSQVCYVECYAKCRLKNGRQIRTDVVTLTLLSEIPENYRLSEAAADRQVGSLLASEEYQAAGTEEKAELLEELMTSLEEGDPSSGEAAVAEGSWYYDEATVCFYYTEAAGSSCVIDFRAADEGTWTAASDLQTDSTSQTDSALAGTDSGSSAADGTDNRADVSENDENGDAEQAARSVNVFLGESGSRAKRLEEAQEIADQFDSYEDISFTGKTAALENLRTKLDDADYTAICCHGGLYQQMQGDACPCFRAYDEVEIRLLQENGQTEIAADKAASETVDDTAELPDEQTQFDLNRQYLQKQMLAGEDGSLFVTYLVTPGFIRHYYADDALNNTFIHLSSCSSLGENSGKENDLLAQSFLDCGARGVLAYSGSVTMGYDQGILGSMMDGLEEGNSMQGSYTYALEDNGPEDPEGDHASPSLLMQEDTDYCWFEKEHDFILTEEEKTVTAEAIAFRWIENQTEGMRAVSEAELLELQTAIDEQLADPVTEYAISVDPGDSVGAQLYAPSEEKAAMQYTVSDPVKKDADVYQITVECKLYSKLLNKSFDYARVLLDYSYEYGLIGGYRITDFVLDYRYMGSDEIQSEVQAYYESLKANDGPDASAGYVASYAMGTTCSYDLDGDRSKDSITVTKVDADHYRVVVNDTGGSFTISGVGNYYSILNLDDDNREVYIGVSGYSNSGSTTIYGYRNGYLQRVGTIGGYISNPEKSGGTVKIHGDKTITSTIRLGLFQNWTAQTSYRMKNYEFYDETDWYTPANGNLNPTAAVDVTAYQSNSTDSGKVTIPAGRTIHLRKTDNKNWISFTMDSSGTIYWLYVNGYNVPTAQGSMPASQAFSGLN